jgi:hypothetical protein
MFMIVALVRSTVIHTGVAAVGQLMGKVKVAVFTVTRVAVGILGETVVNL